MDIPAKTVGARSHQHTQKELQKKIHTHARKGGGGVGGGGEWYVSQCAIKTSCDILYI